MNAILRSFLISGIVFVLAGLGHAGSALPNVLIIAIDDLRPELACYGAGHIHSPNIDGLAARGTLFSRAYCQYALCGPSRTSVFTGLRPDRSGAYGNKQHFRDRLPEAVSLPQYFKAQGYRTYGIGKILHNTQKDPPSWTEPQWYELDFQYASPGLETRKAGIDGIHGSNGELPLFEGPEAEDEAYRDGMALERAVATLEAVAPREEPFLLFVGFHKPHTPFNAPKRYWDLYDREALPLAESSLAPVGAPGMALSDWRYVRSFAGMPDEGPMPESLAREVRHAYFACVSYIDALVGELVAALEATGEADNTLIALWSDHGYQLGDHGMWCKHTNFETSTRVPLILVDPRQGAPGGVCDTPVELVDLFPTLADLAGLPAPEGVDGKSLAVALDDPDVLEGVGHVAYSQYHRGGARGYSVRSPDYRYTEWRDAKRGEVLAREFYDHTLESSESVSWASSPEFREPLRIHEALLRRQWPRAKRAEAWK